MRKKKRKTWWECSGHNNAPMPKSRKHRSYPEGQYPGPWDGRSNIEAHWAQGAK